MFLIQNLFAQTLTTTEPTSYEEMFKLIEYLFTHSKGLGVFGIVLGITQVAMFLLNKNDLSDIINGKVKIVLVALFTLITSVCGVKLANPSFGFWSIAFSSIVLTALQALVFDIYKQFFKKS